MRNRILHTGITCAVVFATGPLHAAVPAVSGNLDAAGDTTIGLERPAPQLTPVTPAPTEPKPLSGAPIDNPLWAIPLSELKYTRERPLFTPSRQPLAPAVVAVPRPVIAPKVVIRQPEPEHPNLQLIGTVVSDAEGIGVFLDQSNRSFIRLKTGEGHRGWILRMVKARQVVLQKGLRSETLRLPVPVAGGRHDPHKPE